MLSLRKSLVSVIDTIKAGDNMREDIPYVKLRECWPDIPVKTRRMARDLFLELWGPMLKENGFIRIGTAWYRVHGDQILQGIEFNPHLKNKYITNLEVTYNLWPMFAEQCGFPLIGFVDLQQSLTDYYYPSYKALGTREIFSYTTWTTVDMDENGVLSKGEPHQIIKERYASFFAMFHDVKTAIEAEYDLFCERTLPTLDKLSDPLSYAKNNLERRMRSLPYKHCVGLSPKGVDTLLAQEEWWLAEKSLRICLNSWKSGAIGNEWYANWYNCALQHVLARDTEWLPEHFRQNVASNWKTIKKWNLRFYKECKKRGLIPSYALVDE